MRTYDVETGVTVAVCTIWIEDISLCMVFVHEEETSSDWFQGPVGSLPFY